ncbi:MAG: indole-3-glycerol phosphate synthase TrpC, partial [Gemmatimonadetes bacterium]
RDFAAALGAGRRGPGEVSVIAEVKRRSPGAGAIRPDLDPVALAARYVAAGAAAVSVLTDREYFAGSLDDLVAVRARVDVPVLRKDFVIDPLQVYEARAAGADAVLLIVRILDDEALAELHGLAVSLGLGVLVEAHDAEEVERALAAGARVVGVNNRDLSTFRTDLSTTLALAGRVPADRVLVAESGIAGGDDVERLGAAGVDAVLVGEWLLRGEQVEARVAELTGYEARVRGGGAR